MKIYLKNQENFDKDTIKFYKENFELVSNKTKADVIVINDFKRITTKKPVACNSTGLDHIFSPKIISLNGSDLDDLTAVPELCLGMAIYLTRLFKKEELKGKSLGIIGYGRIGKKFSEYAQKLGMDVYSYDSKNPVNKLDLVLKKSDIISLHITAEQKNLGFVNKSKFEQMKDGAIFLNSARPWLVDTSSLKWALDNKLAGAWFDFQLDFSHDKLITTPHLGGTTKESKKKSEMLIAKKLKYEYQKGF
jgi:phosphoglycerate dehydrogenase-like enzyme